jgi:hypothetical protein
MEEGPHAMERNSGLARALSTLRELPCVLGSLACDGRGHLLEASIPPQLERAPTGEAAKLIAEASGALEVATGRVALLDFRYQEARIVVKPFEGGFLLLLCTGSALLEQLVGALSAGSAEVERSLRAPAV